MENQQCSSRSGDMYVRCAELELILHDDVARAGELLNEAQELGCSEMARYYNVQGYVLFRTGEIDRGIQFLKKSIELDSSITSLETLAEVLASNHDDRTIEVCQRILRQDHENCSAHVCLGMQAIKSGNIDEALLIAKQAQNLATTARGFFSIGRLYRELGEYQKAVDAYSEAARRKYEPKGPLYAAMSSCYYAMGDFTAASKFSARAIDLNYSDDYTKDVLLWCTGEGHLDSNLDDLIEKYRDTSFVSLILAQRALRDKTLHKAREMGIKAEGANPSAAEMFNIAHLWKNLGDFKRALAACFKSQELGYSVEDRLCHAIADCYYSLGDYDASKRYLLKAITINPDNEQAKELLQLVERKLEENRN